MSISASMVRDLRVQTGAGMMECKKALVECNGSMEDAITVLRKKGVASADKKSSRIAAEGVIVTQLSEDKKQATLVELNCETDFVAKGDEFKFFANEIATVALINKQTDVEKLGDLKVNELTLEQKRREIIAKIGENITIRRVQLIESNDSVGVYQHGNKIGVLVSMNGTTDVSLGKDIAMHIAASKPLAISESELSIEVLDKERKLYKEQALESGKPENIVDKIVEGKIQKYITEITLLGQSFVKNPDESIEKLLKSNNANVNGFYRFEVGEGIEKKKENFAQEIAAQVAIHT